MTVITYERIEISICNNDTIAISTLNTYIIVSKYRSSPKGSSASMTEGENFNIILEYFVEPERKTLIKQHWEPFLKDKGASMQMSSLSKSGTI